jgi:AcrR family transcriptional regulator
MSTSDDHTKRTKRERTRAALVNSTLELVAEKGFAAASLDQIAARAGMTKGAIYSNFDSKAGLLMAAMSARGFTLASDRPPAANLDEELRATAEGLVALLERARGEQALLSEFQLFALGDPELRKGFADIYAAGFGRTADYLAALPGAGAMPPRHLAVALQSLALGFMLQSLVTPDDVTEPVVRETLAALARGLEG